jgi:hypothetical protein
VNHEPSQLRLVLRDLPSRKTAFVHAVAMLNVGLGTSWRGCEVVRMRQEFTARAHQGPRGLAE